MGFPAPGPAWFRLSRKEGPDVPPAGRAGGRRSREPRLSGVEQHSRRVRAGLRPIAQRRRPAKRLRPARRPRRWASPPARRLVFQSTAVGVPQW